MLGTIIKYGILTYAGYKILQKTTLIPQTSKIVPQVGVDPVKDFTRAVDSVIDDIMGANPSMKNITGGMPNIGPLSPFGIRNNNPGNIRYNSANNWQGQTGQNSGFAVFSSALYGIRALARLLRNYQSQGLMSIRQIITKWAPGVENNTGAYINHVSAMMNTSADVPLNLSNAATMSALVKAIITHENGQQPYSDALINQGISLA